MCVLEMGSAAKSDLSGREAPSVTALAEARRLSSVEVHKCVLMLKSWDKRAGRGALSLEFNIKQNHSGSVEWHTSSGDFLFARLRNAFVFIFTPERSIFRWFQINEQTATRNVSAQNQYPAKR